MAIGQPKVVLDNLAFPECPRWHEGKLFFSDVHACKVYSVSPTMQVEVVCEVPGEPAGLGWLPDGRMQIVSMNDQRVLRIDGGRVVEVADLSPYCDFKCNDMVIDSTGRAYVGSYGFDLDGGGEPTSTVLVAVEPDGEVWPVIEGLLFPNGSVITPDGKTLIVAESFGQRLSAYHINDDGSLSDARVWADLRPNVPDGICLDAEGAIWVADPLNHGAMRVKEGAGVVDWVSTGDRGAYACCIGGSDGKKLFLCTAESSNPDKTVELMSGRIEIIDVEVGMP